MKGYWWDSVRHTNTNNLFLDARGIRFLIWTIFSFYFLDGQWIKSKWFFIHSIPTPDIIPKPAVLPCTWFCKTNFEGVKKKKKRNNKHGVSLLVIESCCLIKKGDSCKSSSKNWAVFFLFFSLKSMAQILSLLDFSHRFKSFWNRRVKSQKVDTYDYGTTLYEENIYLSTPPCVQCVTQGQFLRGLCVHPTTLPWAEFNRFEFRVFLLLDWLPNCCGSLTHLTIMNSSHHY